MGGPVMLGIEIQQAPDHFLVFGALFLGLILEKINRGFAQGNGDLDVVVLENQLFRRRQEILNHPGLNRFIRVGNFPAHIFSSPGASIRHR